MQYYRTRPVLREVPKAARRQEESWVERRASWVSACHLPQTHAESLMIGEQPL